MDKPRIAKEESREFLVVGLVRNCENTIERDVLKLAKALSSARTLKWLLIESDSNDDTIFELERLKASITHFNYISLGSLAQKIPLRTERIAHCRNRYLDEIVQNPTYAKGDYVIVSDFDGMNTLLTPEAIASCFARQDWDVCTANQRAPYYDIWALRHPLWSPADCIREFKFLKDMGAGEEGALSAAIFSKMLRISEDSNWIEVNSAFGGLAIYRRDAIGDARYNGLNELGEEQCEHVALHSTMRSAGFKIFVNPRLVNVGYTKHSRELLYGARFIRHLLRARRFIKTFFKGANGGRENSGYIPGQ